MFPARHRHDIHSERMRRLSVCALLLLSLAIGALAGPASGQAMAFEFQAGDAVVVSTDALNVRSAPGTSAAVICVADAGTGLTILDGPEAADGFTWYLIRNAAGVNGWVAGEYLTLGSGEDGLTFAVGDTVAVATDLLNLRAGPSLSAGVLHIFEHSNVMTITGEPTMADGYVWYPVEAWVKGPISGWVVCKYLVQVAAPPDDDDPSGFPPLSTVRVDTDLLNVRTGAGLAYPVIRQVSGGTVFMIGSGPVVADGYSWYTVEVPDQPTSGWVAGDFLTLVSDDGSTEQPSTGIVVGGIAVVDTPALNGRTGPGLSAAVLQVLTGGTEVDVLDGPVIADGYHWYQVGTGTGAVIWVIGEGLAA